MDNQSNYNFQINYYQDHRGGNYVQSQGGLSWTSGHTGQRETRPVEVEKKEAEEKDEKIEENKPSPSKIATPKRAFHNKLSGKPSRLEKIFSMSDASSEYCDEGKYDEAYGLLKRLYKLGASVSMIPVLIDYYETLFKTYRGDESEPVFEQLVATTKENLKPTVQECLDLGEKFRESQQYFKSILLYQIGGVLLEDVKDADCFLSNAQRCAMGVKVCVMAVLEITPTYTDDLKLHIIPKMHKMVSCISRLKGKRKRHLCVSESMSKHQVEFCEFLVGDLDAREKTLRDTINLLETTLGEDEAKKFRVYGMALNNLGATLLQKHKPIEAKAMLLSAIAVNNTAEDYVSPEERKEDLNKTQAAMASAEEMLESMQN